MATTTLNDLLARATAQQEKQGDSFTYQLDGKELVFNRVSEELIFSELDSVTSVAKEHAVSGSMKMADHLIYHCCPQLQDKELQTALGVDEPWDVVRKVFTLVERNQIGGELLDWLGVADLIGDAKNG